MATNMVERTGVVQDESTGVYLKTYSTVINMLSNKNDSDHTQFVFVHFILKN
jgi:hypothetical protein